MTDEKELLCTLALTRLLPLRCQDQRTLLNAAGSAVAVYENRHDIGRMMEHFSPRATQALAAFDHELPRCEQELSYAREHKIKILSIQDEDAYPMRLRQCEDAPLVLYQLGKANLNVPHIISVVGTRKCTERGRDLCQQLAADLARLRPDVLVVSGLAYGIDIAAHRAALDHQLATAAVLAHGLDTIYPPLHRATAIQMLENGALITEYMSQAHVDKVNFIQRNRIVATLADAVVVVESAEHGGSLITAEMANGYNREVCAFPGRITDKASAGCNRLIRRNEARLITSAQDLLDDLGWPPAQLPDGQQMMNLASTEPPPAAEPNEQSVLDALKRAGGDLTLSDLIVQSTLPLPQLTPLLFTLEMKGAIKKLPGNRYHLASLGMKNEE